MELNWEPLPPFPQSKTFGNKYEKRVLKQWLWLKPLQAKNLVVEAVAELWTGVFRLCSRGFASGIISGTPKGRGWNAPGMALLPEFPLQRRSAPAPRPAQDFACSPLDPAAAFGIPYPLPAIPSPVLFPAPGASCSFQGEFVQWKLCFNLGWI